MTARWPKHTVDFTGKRIAVIGTGASAVQSIPLIAQTAQHVTVFQRTPNYVIPSRNYPLDDVHRQAIRQDHDAIWAQAHGHFFGMAFNPANRVLEDVTPEEQQRILEAAWEAGGFRFLFETFDDIWINEASNQTVAEFIRTKIRTIVSNPATAELLCPKGYPLAGKRPPLGQSYYETFNRENVTLVDVREHSIEEITPNGLRTSAHEYEVDMIVCATGFDVATGPLTCMDIRGRGGQALVDRWADGPKTYLGLSVDGFPNMFMICGPQTPFANIPTVIEQNVKWIIYAISYMQKKGYSRMESTVESGDQWAAQLQHFLDATVLAQGEKANSWFLGANIPGKPHVVLFHFGGTGVYGDYCDEVADQEFRGFVTSA
jgi:cyclohexanone monooxygenase